MSEEKAPEPKNVYEAINYVMQKVGYVQKEASGGVPYSYASEAALIRAIRPHMVEVGLFIYPSELTELPSEPFTSQQGKVINVTKLSVRYCFHHAPSGSEFFVSVIGKGMDTGDKDSNKAMTGAYKYAIRQPLMIETGDDPDKTSNGEFERTKPEHGESISRLENQWEKDIVDKLVDLQLVQARPHAVNILNRSPFMSVPYHQLEMVEAVAYIIGWQQLKESLPDMSTDERNAAMNKSWAEGNNEDCLAKAIEMLGG